MSKYEGIKGAMSIILLLYIFASFVFVILPALNNYQEYIPCDHYLYEIFLENYTPYSLSLLCGFLFGNTLFTIIWFSILEIFYRSFQIRKSVFNVL